MSSTTDIKSFIMDQLSMEEGETLEFRTSVPEQETLAKYISSFANTNGGIIIFGVYYRPGVKEVRGVSDASARNSVAQLDSITQSIAKGLCKTGEVKVDGKKLLYVMIEKVNEERFPITTSSGKVYIRNGHNTIGYRPNELGEVLGRDRIILQSTANKKKLNAFVAMSFREEQEPALADYFAAMKRAAKASTNAIHIKRVDLEDGDFDIVQKMIEMIDESDFIITDFTMNSHNVYFELGYARGKKKIVIQTAREGTALEFDIKGRKTIFYRNATELEAKLLKVFDNLEIGNPEQDQ